VVFWMGPELWQLLLYGLAAWALQLLVWAGQRRYLLSQGLPHNQATRAAARSWWPFWVLWLIPAMEIFSTWQGGFLTPLALGQEAWPLAVVAAAACTLMQTLACRPAKEKASLWDLNRRWPAGVAAVLALACFLAIGIRIEQLSNESAPLLGGDEPQYLFITHSLVVDHDLDLANQVLLRESYFSLTPEQVIGGHSRWTNRYTLLSKHLPGLPILMAPFYAWGLKTGISVRLTCSFLIWGLSLWMILELFHLAREATQRQGPALAAAAFMALSLPVLLYSNLLFPETAAAAFTIAAFRRLQGADPAQGGKILAAGILTAYLPWLNERFILPCLLLAALFVSQGLWRRKRALALFLGPCLLSMGLLAWYYYIHWGQPWPRLGLHGTGVYLNPRGLGEGILGLLLDGAEGLLPYAPVWLAGLAGLIWLIRKQPRLGIFSAAFFITAWLSAGLYQEWYGGQNPPARYLVSIMPFLALGLAAGLRWGPPRLWICLIVLGFVTVAADAAVWHDLAGAYGDWKGRRLILSQYFLFPLADGLLPAFLRPLRDAGTNYNLAILWMAMIGAAVLVLQWGRRRFFPGRSAACLALTMVLICTAAAAGEALGTGLNVALGNKQKLVLWQRVAKIQGEKWIWPSLPSAGRLRDPLNMDLPPARFRHDPARRLKDSPTAVLVAPSEKPGLVIWGQYLTLPPGRYQLEVRMSTPYPGLAQVAWADVTVNGGKEILARQDISGRTARSPVMVEFELPRKAMGFEARVGVTGWSQVVIKSMRLSYQPLTRDQTRLK
jgi:hypothetical protein